MINNDMLGYFATSKDRLDDVVEELARAGYPDCNTDQVQNEVARKFGFNDMEDMYDYLEDDAVHYINSELRRKLL